MMSASGPNPSEHQPFPIAAFTHGLMLDKEPWLSPQNAFRMMTNARIFRGQLQKRSGSSHFAELGQDAVGATIPNPVAQFGNDPLGVPTCAYTTSSGGGPGGDKAVPESCTFTRTNGINPDMEGEILQQVPIWQWVRGNDAPNIGFWNGFAWTWVVTAKGTSTPIGQYAWRTPTAGIICQIKIQWSLHPDISVPDTNPGVLNAGWLYWDNAELEVMGLTTFENSTGNHALAWDTDALYLYDPAVSFYKRQAATVPFAFTGTDKDYFWSWPLDDYIVFTNNVDPVYKWDPAAAPAASISEMPTDWTGGANQLNRCALVIRFRGRLIYFNTSEVVGGLFPTRARWTGPGSFTFWNSPLDFADAPANLGEIVTGEFIGERLFIGFEKGWMELVATGDAILPFEWRPFISRFGAVSKMSTIRDNERLLTRSKATMQGLDPNGQYYIDQAIPDLVKDYNQGEVGQCVGTRNEDQRAFWWTYVKQSSSRPDNVLCATYDEEGVFSWSDYSIRFNVFSDFDSEKTPTWNSLGPAPWQNYAVSWNSARVGAPGTTLTIGGSDLGIVSVFDSSLIDFRPEGPDTINLDIVSQELAPFPGQLAHWGWLDLFLVASKSATITMYFYADTQQAPYLTKTISLEVNGLATKMYRRVPVDRSAAFHKFQIVSDDGQGIAIDAIVPWFRPAGRIRGIN